VPLQAETAPPLLGKRNPTTYRKAFDSINRTALWQKFISNNVNGKCIKIIYKMYLQAKSCVKINSFSYMSDFFTSHTGVCQGENLSPILFSLSQHFNCLDLLSNVDTFFYMLMTQFYLLNVLKNCKKH
jgi:hypothetical protein